jgi:hypothetical protein
MSVTLLLTSECYISLLLLSRTYDEARVASEAGEEVVESDSGEEESESSSQESENSTSESE